MAPQATINEKVAPELLEYDAPLMASIEAQIEHQVSITSLQSLQRLSHLSGLQITVTQSLHTEYCLP